MYKYLFNLVVLMLLLIKFHPTDAQSSSRPFLEEGKIWKYEFWDVSYIDDIDMFNGILSLVIRGDTIINNRNCFKSYLTMRGKSEYFVALYEEGGKVYFYDDGSVSPSLLYDFGISIEDSVYCNDLDEYIYCLDIDTIDVCGELYARYHFYNDFSNVFVGNERIYGYEFFTYWIDGIGGVRWPFKKPFYGKAMTEFKSCTLDDRMLFTQEDFYQIANIKSAITESPSDNRQEIYDLQGRRVQTPQRGGLYIQGGRKFIFR